MIPRISDNDQHELPPYTLLTGDLDDSKTTDNYQGAGQLLAHTTTMANQPDIRYTNVQTTLSPILHYYTFFLPRIYTIQFLNKFQIIMFPPCSRRSVHCGEVRAGYFTSDECCCEPGSEREGESLLSPLMCQSSQPSGHHDITQLTQSPQNNENLATLSSKTVSTSVPPPARNTVQTVV